MCDAFQLQHEVAVRSLRLQLATPVFHVEPACVGHRELTGHLGVSFPARQILAIEQICRIEWLQLDVTKLDLTLVQLQTDVTTV